MMDEVIALYVRDGNAVFLRDDAVSFGLFRSSYSFRTYIVFSITLFDCVSLDLQYYAHTDS